MVRLISIFLYFESLLMESFKRQYFMTANKYKIYFLFKLIDISSDFIVVFIIKKKVECINFSPNTCEGCIENISK